MSFSVTSKGRTVITLIAATLPEGVALATARSVDANLNACEPHHWVVADETGKVLFEVERVSTWSLELRKASRAKIEAAVAAAHAFVETLSPRQKGLAVMPFSMVACGEQEGSLLGMRGGLKKLNERFPGWKVPRLA